MQNLIQEAIDYALTNSLLKFNTKYELVHAPLALTPYQISRELLDKMTALTPLFNELMIKVSRDTGFLEMHLELTARTDDFVSALLDIQRETGLTQADQLLISRNDFLMSAQSDLPGVVAPKQVEFNTIAASYPFLSGQLNHLHRFIFNSGRLGEKAGNIGGNVVENDPMKGIVEVMAEAVNQYGHQNACVLSIVQANEQNIFDQRGGEYALWNKYGIPTLRYSLDEVASQGSLREGHLMIQNRIAAVTYFRAGYTPEDYQTADAWKGRQLIEASSSIAVPNISMQLAGLKKIQQVLANPKVLRSFVDEEAARQIEATFVGLYLLNDLIENPAGTEKASESACRFPKNFVLKPQREGGGNNFYEEEMIQRLKTLNEDEREAYILMERINSPVHHARLMKEGDVQESNCISEIGSYGVCLTEGGVNRINRDVGYLVRTKMADQNEGGVSAGYAYLNSLCHPV
ncbi:MAG: glutathione synthase [SAR324 cluster bacterium]|nr:glutathione synthase [SAR324 cluster bacterium]